MTKIKAIIFDLDNTLIDLMKLKQMAVEAAVSAMQDAGLKMNRNKIVKAIDGVYKEKGIEYQHVFDDVLKKLIGRIDYKILAAGVSAYRRVKSAHLDPYPNVVPTLIKLIKNGYKLCIVSDAPKMQIWSRLCDTKLQHFFDFVISAEDAERKPSTLMFKKTLAVLRLKPEQVLMVGDMIGRDVVGAKKAGMKTALAKYGITNHKLLGIRRKREPKKVKPDYLLKDISDLVKIV